MFLDEKKTKDVLDIHVVSKKGFPQHEKSIIKAGNFKGQIFEWLENVVLKRFVERNILSLLDVLEDCDDNGVEDGCYAIAQINLSDSEIKELFAKCATIRAEEIIKQARKEA